MIVLLALACTGTPSPPGPVRSQPAPPVADLGGDATGPSKVIVTPLTQVFARGEVAPPKVLARITPGMSRTQAVELLEATDPNGQPILTRSIQGQDLDSLLHITDPPVRLYVVSADGTLLGINVGLPFESATLALDDLWGSATPGPTTGDGRVTHLWKGPTWSAKLSPLPDAPDAPPSLVGRGLLEIRPTG
ncbi:MAG: hypothetical protein AAF211_30490 [Myxococcota bacterium]